MYSKLSQNHVHVMNMMGYSMDTNHLGGKCFLQSVYFVPRTNLHRQSTCTIAYNELVFIILFLILDWYRLFYLMLYLSTQDILLFHFFCVFCACFDKMINNWKMVCIKLVISILSTYMYIHPHWQLCFPMCETTEFWFFGCNCCV